MAASRVSESEREVEGDEMNGGGSCGRRPKKRAPRTTDDLVGAGAWWRTVVLWWSVIVWHSECVDGWSRARTEI